jgi:uncharacterized protein YvpB
LEFLSSGKEMKQNIYISDKKHLCADFTRKKLEIVFNETGKRFPCKLSDIVKGESTARELILFYLKIFGLPESFSYRTKNGKGKNTFFFPKPHSIFRINYETSEVYSLNPVSSHTHKLYNSMLSSIFKV